MPAPAAFPSLTKTWHNDKHPTIDASRPDLALPGQAVVITGGAGSVGVSLPNVRWYWVVADLHSLQQQRRSPLLELSM
jgi:hypothetical protein